MLFIKVKAGKLYSDHFKCVRYECFLEDEDQSIFMLDPWHQFYSMCRAPRILVKSCIDKEPFGSVPSSMSYLSIAHDDANRANLIRRNDEWDHLHRKDRAFEVLTSGVIGGYIVQLIHMLTAHYLGLV